LQFLEQGVLPDKLGLAFNPQKQEFDGMISDDKSGGKEFFTVANSRYAL